jgi:FPC/CPF motif-containing protein YcgG
MDVSSPQFSFSLCSEAFYIIGLHPASNRKARQFSHPALVFNPHAQFELLRHGMKYEPMKLAVRKRDTSYSGSVNPMLQDFGTQSEVSQYSGRIYDKGWSCPLKINHGLHERYSAT